jgi:hypothetical protein
MGDKPTPVIAGLLPHVYNEGEIITQPPGVHYDH